MSNEEEEKDVIKLKRDNEPLHSRGLVIRYQKQTRRKRMAPERGWKRGGISHTHKVQLAGFLTTLPGHGLQQSQVKLALGDKRNGKSKHPSGRATPSSSQQQLFDE